MTKIFLASGVTYMRHSSLRGVVAPPSLRGGNHEPIGIAKGRGANSGVSPNGPLRRVLRTELRQIAIKLERLGVGERLAVLDRPAVHDVADSEFDDLAGFGARNIGDGDDLRRNVPRACAEANRHLDRKS